MGRMARFGAWTVKNADGVIALILAVVFAVVGVIVDFDFVQDATLLVLALVATALLRDRWRQEPMEEVIQESFRTTSGALAELPAGLRRLEQLETLVARTRQSLDDMSVVRVLNSSEEIAQAHADARRGTDRWMFKGGTGTYLRAVTLPECVGAARRERRALLMRLEIIDPTVEKVCADYARFRRSMSDAPDATGEIWTTDRARKESFATILAACWYRQRFGLLDIDIGLSATMTTFRWDLSASAVIVTGDNQHRAMIGDRGGFYYDGCSTELLTSLEQARRVPLEAARDVPLSDEPTVDEARRLFSTLGLALPGSYGDRDVVEIIRKAIRPKNPYATV
jgi:hypothetical protein